ncbi:hypothetical protein BJV82DRAFT_635715 [Fennellomyces sp. T-0311]|nr:hypothetical protein BJV82DRAFT_635715 [Fennellomyces sp. T-0311]
MVQAGLFSLIGAGLIMFVSNASAQWASVNNKERTFYCENFPEATDRTKECCHTIEEAEVWLRGNLTYCLVPAPAAPLAELDLFAYACCAVPDFNKDDH